MSRVRTSLGIALAAGAVLAGASACGGNSSASTPTTDAKAPAKPTATATPSPTKSKPAGPPMLLDTITPLTGTTVGVAMPVSVVFTKPVASRRGPAVEKHLKITTSVPTTGAWHWFSSTRVDFRPQDYWKPGTKVSDRRRPEGRPDGNGRYGTHSYHALLHHR